MADGSNGAATPFEEVAKEARELSTQIKGLNISIINLTNAVNRFTLNHDRISAAEREILDNTKTIIDHVVDIKQKVG